MASAGVTTRPIVVALIGNPNTGKSTVFSALAGVRQRVGNYPGVTVEKRVGRAQIAGRRFLLIDLPGAYSLAPRSPDEMVAVDVLLGRAADVPAPDVVLCIVDASNLERNLYLLSQVLELGRPVVVAVNMTDVAAARGIRVDAGALAERLGVPVVATQANRRVGLEALRDALVRAAGGRAPRAPRLFPEAFHREAKRLAELAGANGRPSLPGYLAERLLLDASGYLSRALERSLGPAVLEELEAARRRLGQAGVPIPEVEPEARYAWARRVIDSVVEQRQPEGRPLTDWLDRVLTHRLWGSLVFAIMIAFVFQAVFYVAEPASLAIDWLKTWLAGFVEANLSEGPLRSLLVDGAIEGVGAVLVFLPQIFTLFFFIAVLEDCGYMARSAYLMDRVMVRLGLSGKSFIPLLASFACAIPGIMAARVIENPRDRLATILVAPLMSCSARLPVYTLFVGAFIADRRYLGGLVGLRGLVMLAMYLVGLSAAVAVSLVLKRFLLRAEPQPFLMELPTYKWPSPQVVAHRVLERGWCFVRQAGTLIFAISVLVWAASYFPRAKAVGSAERLRLEAALAAAQADDSPQAERERERLRRELRRWEAWAAGEQLRQSYLGRAGRWIAPVVRPLGWDWRIGCAVVASFPAREVVVASLSVIYHAGPEAAEDPGTLGETLRRAVWEGTDRPVFTVPVALSIMVFFALCAQCASTLAVIRRETNSWRWPAFAFSYMTALAYLGALATYQIGTWLSTGLGGG